MLRCCTRCSSACSNAGPTFLQKFISLRTSMMETSCGVVTTTAPSTRVPFKNCGGGTARIGWARVETCLQVGWESRERAGLRPPHELSRGLR